MPQIWWTVHRDTTLRLLFLGGAIASMVTVVISFSPPVSELPSWAIGLLTIAALLVVLLVIVEWRSVRSAHAYAGSDTDGIRQYMQNWIRNGGRVAIWTRDMSWANNTETVALLREKAESNDLIICLPQPTELTNELAGLGAEICAYGDENLDSPASRFTIAFWGRDGTRVAIGRAVGDSHVITEFDARSDPAYHVAADLVALARKQ